MIVQWFCWAGVCSGCEPHECEGTVTDVNAYFVIQRSNWHLSALMGICGNDWSYLWVWFAQRQLMPSE